MSTWYYTQWECTEDDNITLDGTSTVNIYAVAGDQLSKMHVLHVCARLDGATNYPFYMEGQSPDNGFASLKDLVVDFIRETHSNQDITLRFI